MNQSMKRVYHEPRIMYLRSVKLKKTKLVRIGHLYIYLKLILPYDLDSCIQTY